MENSITTSIHVLNCALKYGGTAQYELNYIKLTRGSSLLHEPNFP